MNTRPAPNDPPRIRLVAPVAAVAGGLLSPVSWSAPGDLDSAFGDVGRVDPLPDLSGQLWSLEVLENGDSVLAGNEEEYFFYWGAYYDEHGFFTAIGPEGEALADFAAGRLDNFSVRDLVRTADGKLVAVGESDDLRRIRIVRINADGTADPGFGTGGFVDVSFPGSAPVAGPALVADADGRITVFGISSSGEFLMARVLPSGAPDVTFGSNGVLSTTVPGVVLSPYSADALVRLSDGTFRVTVRARPAGSTDTYAAVRRTRSAPILEALHAWLRETIATLSAKSPLAQAIQYTLTRWTALARYVEDGAVEIDNNAAERAIRALVLGRRNYLFAGSDAGGETAARLYSLIGTCRLNGLDPHRYLRHVLERIATHPINRIESLLPWHVAPSLEIPQQRAA